jgi:hypothetical protein
MGIKPYFPLQTRLSVDLSSTLHDTEAYYSQAVNRINPSAGVWQTEPWILVGRHPPNTGNHPVSN